uniref:Uncharacterized protein n=1 Tax=Cucumis melo TaxID=3656 RepID=A0A9I9EIC5_CUCME
MAVCMRMNYKEYYLVILKWLVTKVQMLYTSTESPLQAQADLKQDVDLVESCLDHLKYDRLLNTKFYLQQILPDVDNDFSTHEKHIARIIKQIGGIEENVRAPWSLHLFGSEAHRISLTLFYMAAFESNESYHKTTGF